MKYSIKGHELLRHFYRKHGITQASQVDLVNSDKAQVSKAMSGENEKVLAALVRVFLEKYGTKEPVEWEDFFPPERSIETRIQVIEEGQKMILELLKRMEKKIEKK